MVEHPFACLSVVKRIMFFNFILSVCVFASTGTLAKLTWADTEFFFAFGDSYTTDGFNISAGVDSPDPGFVSTSLPVNDTLNE